MRDYRIIRFHTVGGPEVLQLERASMPEAGPGEVFLRVLGIGVTQGDIMFRRGTYLEKPNLPSGLGTEICGRIEACGPGVTKFRVGDRVSSISTFSINRYPIYGECAVLPETALIRTPAEFSDLEGAGFTLAFVPMYLALVREARVKAGDWVVLTAAGATTSLAALQIAKIAGARVIGAVRNPEKVRPLEAVGYDAVLVDDDGMVDQVRRITGSGANIVLDPVLGPRAGRLSELSGGRDRSDRDWRRLSGIAAGCALPGLARHAGRA